MRWIQEIGIALCVAAICVIVVPTARAGDGNRQTVITFSSPVEVPGGSA